MSLTLNDNMLKFFSKPNENFFLAVAMGRIPNYEAKHLVANAYGQNIADGTKTVWDYTGKDVSFATNVFFGADYIIAPTSEFITV